MDAEDAQLEGRMTGSNLDLETTSYEEQLDRDVELGKRKYGKRSAVATNSLNAGVEICPLCVSVYL